MNLLEKTDEEILEIADPLWDELVESSNKKDYLGFIKHFSKAMILAASEVEIGKQWASNETHVSFFFFFAFRTYRIPCKGRATQRRVSHCELP